MLPKPAQSYIYEQTLLMAEHVHPGNKDLQNQFMIGFLSAQLAHTFYQDSANYTRFKNRVHELGYTSPAPAKRSQP